MRAVLYCRVSTAEQTNNLSLPTQEKACREYCAKHGYDVGDVFIDAGESAKSTDRPEFLRLLAYCREHQGRVHAVVVYSLTRFSRQQADHHAITTLLRGLGITLRSVTEPIDESPSGKLMEGILAAMAQFDNDARAQRVTAGMHAARERGRWVNRPPIGYLVGGRGKPSLIPDPERAPLIREAFALRAAGISGRPLLQSLTAKGLRDRKGQPVKLTALYVLLQNRAYLGLLKTAAAADQPGDFEPLVDQETFDRVQGQLVDAPTSTRAIARHRNHSGFPLRRFARCAVCDRPLTGSTSKGRHEWYPFYHCPKGCTRVRAGVLEAQFLTLLDHLRPTPEAWAFFRTSVLRAWERQREDIETKRRGLTKDIAALKAKERRLDEAFLFERSIDRETYHPQRDAIRQERAMVEIDMAALGDAAQSIEADLDYAADVFAHGRLLWLDAASVETRQRLQWTLFPNGIAVQRGSTRAEGAAYFEPQISAVNCLDFFDLQDESLPTARIGGPNQLNLEPVLAWLAGIRRLRLAA